jgi:plastocyanin
MTRRFILSAIAMSFAIEILLIGIALAGENYPVSQKNRAFNLISLSVNKGDVVLFVNDDEFIHQIYVKSNDFNIDTEESEPGKTISVPFTVAGTFEVLCHIHPKMHMTVTVK